MLEVTLTRKIKRWLNTLNGVVCWKIHGSRYSAGLPDLMCCVGGRFVGIEVKIAPNGLTALQEHTLNQIEAAGGVALVAYNLSDIQSHDLFRGLKARGNGIEMASLESLKDFT